MLFRSLKIDMWKEKITLYKDAVTGIEGIAPVSVSWAKKHVLGFSDEEIKLDLQQQRIEKAVGAELTNTATIITHSGIFDTIDALYKPKAPGAPEGAAGAPGAPPPPGGEAGGAPPPPPGPEAGGAPPPPGPEPGGAAGVTPESEMRDNMKILLESDSLIEDDSFIDLSKGKNSLGKMEEIGRVHV